MVEAIESRGGAVFVRCPVAQILRDPASEAACGVVLFNGDVVRARRVVSAVGYRATEALLRATTGSSNDDDGGVGGGSPPPAGWRRELFKQAGAKTPSGAAHPLYKPPPRPLKTGQSAGFVMGNIALDGTASELGITDATLWLQPGDKTNGFDALKGCEQFLKDPLGVPLEQIPAGITFPSVKGSVRDGTEASDRRREHQLVASHPCTHHHYHPPTTTITHPPTYPPTRSPDHAMYCTRLCVQCVQCTRACTRVSCRCVLLRCLACFDSWAGLPDSGPGRVGMVC